MKNSNKRGKDCIYIKPLSLKKPRLFCHSTKTNLKYHSRRMQKNCLNAMVKTTPHVVRKLNFRNQNYYILE